ncbi:MAG: c-type cytochrome [Planctomycetes bacterium]|nr:c-type cytochrome [Verrucomicrobiota bacterium]MBM4047573.1 c-type cytochrome [Planctomycetota bacterium]
MAQPPTTNHRPPRLQMTPRAVVIGSMVAFSAVVAAVVFLPTFEDRLEPSATHRVRTTAEDEGRRLYIANGCQYCHSQYVRPQDWDYGQDRVAQAGDYVSDTPPLLGSERQGPDLSQEGGLRSDDWHRAHFANPRFTRPDSIMPPFAFLTEAQTQKLTAYVQSLGGTDADARVARQRAWQQKALDAYRAGPAANMAWLHSHVPTGWMQLPNPYPATEAALKRGEAIYLHFCIGCHGPVGDGQGPAARLLDPPPFNFTFLRRWNGPIGGMIYHQVMNGITGTSMPAFKTELESEKIWDVSNYIAEYFVSGADADRGPRGIPASFEPPRPDEPTPKEK